MKSRVFEKEDGTVNLFKEIRLEAIDDRAETGNMLVDSKTATENMLVDSKAMTGNMLVDSKNSFRRRDNARGNTPKGGFTQRDTAWRHPSNPPSHSRATPKPPDLLPPTLCSGDTLHSPTCSCTSRGMGATVTCLWFGREPRLTEAWGGKRVSSLEL